MEPGFVATLNSNDTAQLSSTGTAWHIGLLQSKNHTVRVRIQTSCTRHCPVAGLVVYKLLLPTWLQRVCCCSCQFTAQLSTAHLAHSASYGVPDSAMRCLVLSKPEALLAQLLPLLNLHATQMQSSPHRCLEGLGTAHSA